MKDKIIELNKLIQENPDIPVKMFVNNDEMCEDENYTNHRIVSVELSGWCAIDEMIYTEESDLAERFYDTNDHLTEKECENLALKNMKMVILIKTGAI